MNRIDVETTDLILALLNVGNEMALELQESASNFARESGDPADGEYYRDLSRRWERTAGVLAAKWLALGERD